VDSGIDLSNLQSAKKKKQTGNGPPRFLRQGKQKATKTQKKTSPCVHALIVRTWTAAALRPYEAFMRLAE
jgi:hypothetical protein